MATFANTTSPTPFGFFDNDSHFQSEADSVVTFVKRSLGDDILSVELTKKQIWMTFERAFLEFGAITNQYQARSNLSTLLGFPTGSVSIVSGTYKTGPTGFEARLPRYNLEFIERLAEPYAMEAGIGGSYNMVSGAISLTDGKQDYDLYTDLKNDNDTALFDTQTAAKKTKMKISEVFHFSPQAAYRYYGSTSGISYLANEFNFESFTPETIFYVLPVFEDILRAAQMDTSSRVRRSNYSYKVIGTKIRIYPTPNSNALFVPPKKLWVRVLLAPDPFSPAYTDKSIYGITDLSNIPYGNLIYSQVNSISRNWVRNYSLALCKELLGLIRSKFSNIPAPGAELQLNGTDLVNQGRDDQETLRTELRDLLDTMTYDKLIEMDADKAENMQRQLNFIPIPNGRAIEMH
jgi:hypothetical protein